MCFFGFGGGVNLLSRGWKIEAVEAVAVIIVIVAIVAVVPAAEVVVAVAAGAAAAGAAAAVMIHHTKGSGELQARPLDREARKLASGTHCPDCSFGTSVCLQIVSCQD